MSIADGDLKEPRGRVAAFEDDFARWAGRAKRSLSIGAGAVEITNPTPKAYAAELVAMKMKVIVASSKVTGALKKETKGTYQSFSCKLPTRSAADLSRAWPNPEETWGASKSAPPLGQNGSVNSRGDRASAARAQIFSDLQYVGYVSASHR